MPYDSFKHRRRSIRLPGYDYSQPGIYFVAIRTARRECLFGKVVGTDMHLNEYGRLVETELLRTSEIRPNVELDAFIVMPNHIHSIFVFHSVGKHSNTPKVGAHCSAPLQRKPQTLGSLIAGFKSTCTKQINILRCTPGAPVWQRNYYDHIIRNESEWERIRQYIARNPALWDEDEDNPEAFPNRPHFQQRTT